MNDLELIDEIVKRAEEHQKQKEKDFAMKELEKIKAEFEDKILLNQTVAIQIMDKHIAELKGENNEIL